MNWRFVQKLFPYRSVVMLLEINAGLSKVVQKEVST